MIRFGNAFAVVIRGLKLSSDLSILTSATATAQLKTSAGVAIGSSVAFVHEGGGDYRAEFAASYFVDHSAELAVGSLVTVEIVGSSPVFAFSLVHRVTRRG